MTPIPWPTLTAEEKKKTFFDAMGVKPTIHHWFLSADDGKSCWHGGFDSEWKAQKRLDEVMADEAFAPHYKNSKVYPLYVYPDLTLDALFALAETMPVEISVRGSKQFGYVASVRHHLESLTKNTVKAGTPIDAACIALLRHAGFEISTEGKYGNKHATKGCPDCEKGTP